MQLKTVVGILLVIAGLIIAYEGVMWYINISTPNQQIGQGLSDIWGLTKSGTIYILTFAVGCLVAFLGTMVIFTKRFKPLAPVATVIVIIILLVMIGYLAYKT
jgi:Ni/Fe-hydrogenase subunit HybB-like protein